MKKYIWIVETYEYDGDGMVEYFENKPTPEEIKRHLIVGLKAQESLVIKYSDEFSFYAVHRHCDEITSVEIKGFRRSLK